MIPPPDINNEMINILDTIAGSLYILSFSLLLGNELSDIAAITSIGASILVGFYTLIRIKKEIQLKHFNSIWHAIKSLFKKRNKYGEK